MELPCHFEKSDLAQNSINFPLSINDVTTKEVGASGKSMDESSILSPRTPLHRRTKTQLVIAQYTR